MDAIADAIRTRQDLAARPFPGFNAGRFRTALARACKASNTPPFSPHDLRHRHRRATLWHQAGVPPVQAATWLGHSPHEHLRTYAHVILDQTELDYHVLVGVG